MKKTNQTKTTDKTERSNKAAKKPKNISDKIVGISLLLVVLSIAYTTTVIFMGTDGIEAKILTTPQIIFAVVLALKQFTK